MKQKATEFIQEEALNNAYSQEVKQLSDEDRMLDVTKERLRKAGEQNKVIGFALKNADELNLDASQTERLSSIKRRNLANMILNSEPVSKENPLMKEIRNKVAEVEKVILKRVSGYLSQTDDLNSPKTIQYLAMRLDDVNIKYQDTIAACISFLDDKDKKSMSPRGAENYNMVQETLAGLLDESNNFHRAQQLLFRKKIGNIDITIKDLLIEARKYMAENPVVTDKEREEYCSSNRRVRTMYADNGQFKDDDFEGKDELKLVYDTLTQNKLPDALINEFKDDPKKQARALSIVKNLYMILGRFKRDTLYSATLMVDKTLVNLFQLEDGSIEMSIEYERPVDDNETAPG
ncbi:MAG: hypothetical protein K6E91_00695 [Butyrivibrio sp.]|nr:hypothetical protein [Butyrivibrio sp.]